mgnify:CR=1 FL=1
MFITRIYEAVYVLHYLPTGKYICYLIVMFSLKFGLQRLIKVTTQGQKFFWVE